jgi:hypothetical protein
MNRKVLLCKVIQPVKHFPHWQLNSPGKAWDESPFPSSTWEREKDSIHSWAIGPPEYYEKFLIGILLTLNLEP